MPFRIVVAPLGVSSLPIRCSDGGTISIEIDGYQCILVYVEDIDTVDKCKAAYSGQNVSDSTSGTAKVNLMTRKCHWGVYNQPYK